MFLGLISSTSSIGRSIGTYLSRRMMTAMATAMQAMEQAKAPKEIKFSEVKNSSILDDKSVTDHKLRKLLSIVSEK